MEFIMSIDSVICIITGAIIGGLAAQLMRSLGLLSNIVIGVVGGLIGGLIFDAANIIDVGDYADPIIAGLVGAVVLLAVIGVVRRSWA